MTSYAFLLVLGFMIGMLELRLMILFLLITFALIIMGVL